MCKIILVILISLLLQGCYSKEEIQSAEKIINASSEEVSSCLLLDTIQSHGNLSLDNARFQLKLIASRLGATHLVETKTLPYIFDENFIGVILKGQAFKCPLEQGPIKDNEKSKLTFSPDEYQYLLYSNFDDGFFFNRHLHRPPPPSHFFRGKRFHRRH